MKRIKASLFVFLILASCISAQAQLKITVYTDDFQGSQYELGVGKYDYMTMLRAGVYMVRSIKVPEGLKVTLYEKDNFQGQSLVITEDANMRYLLAKGFGQVAQNTSLVVAEATKGTSTAPFITIYKDNFSGSSKKLEAGFFDFFELGSVDNDQLSSVRIPKGMKVTLYEHKESGGRSLVLTQDANAGFLVKNKFNDLTSSILVEVEPEPTPVVPPVVVVTPPVTIPSETPIPTPDDPSMVTIFQGDFSGLSKKLTPGRYEAAALGIGDNELSSLKVPDGIRVIMYEQPGFKGKSIRVEEDAGTAYLDAKRFNNLTSSLVVELIPRVTLYKDDYSGEERSFEPGYYQLDELGIGNDALTSVKVIPGVWVLLFEHRDFKGRSLLLMKDASSDYMEGREFNDVTTSMIVGSTDNPLPQVTLYDGNFIGEMKKLTPGEYPMLESGNTISSLEIPRGLRVTLYDKGSFDGKSVMLTKSVGTEFLKNLEFDNVTSSIRVEQIHPRDQVVTIYADSYKGITQDLAPGRYLVRDLNIKNQLSSIRIPQGMQATLYEHDYFKGLTVMLDSDTDYTGSKMFDNIYSSIIVEDVFNTMVMGESITVTNPVVIQAEPVQQAQETESSPRAVYSYDAPCEMTEKEYYNALKAVEAKPFSDDKMATARLATKDKCMTNEQIRGIAKLFNFEEQTLEFVQYAYDQASEKSMYYTLDDVFKFMSSKEAFTKFLSSQPSESTLKTTTGTTQPPVVTEVRPSALRKEAMDFSLKIIGTYFKQDCEVYLSYLSPELLLYEQGGPVAITSEMKTKVCESLLRAVNNKSKTMVDYLATYKVELLTRAEVEEKIGRALPGYFNTTEDEFYFLGYESKNSTTESYIWDDMFRFLVRKTNGTWKLKAPL